MDEAQTERRIADAKAQGRREEKLDNLITVVGEIHKEVKILKKNSEIIHELKTDFDDRKQIKQHILKTAAAKVLNLGGWATAAVLAFFK